MEKHLVICIGRQFGSGGRGIWVLLDGVQHIISAGILAMMTKSCPLTRL